MGYHPKPTPCFFLKKKEKKREIWAHKFSNTDRYSSLLDSGTKRSTRAPKTRVLSTTLNPDANRDWYSSPVNSGTKHSTQAPKARVLSTI